MKLFTPQAMHDVDSTAINTYGIPGVLLMEHAAYNVFKFIKKNFDSKKILILCGAGNNGGDGFALTRQLSLWSNCKVKTVLLSAPKTLTGDAKCYYDICQNTGLSIISYEEKLKKDIFNYIDEYDVIVDSIFGTGLGRDITGVYAEIIDKLNDSNAYVISVDIPSGIDGLTGKVRGVSVEADTTITFVAPKVGMYLYPAPLYVGNLIIADIGMPNQIVEEASTAYYSTEDLDARELLPKRSMRSNKGTYGKVLTIGGQLSMSGAISMTSMAAYRMGCGTVTAVVPNSILEIMQCKLTEVMAIGIESTDGHFSNNAYCSINSLLPKYDVIAIGPGMGRDDANIEIIRSVIKENKPLVIDADALFFLAKFEKELKARTIPAIITPHPGEMSRIIGKPIDVIIENPIDIVTYCSQRFGVIAVLKLEKTVIADISGHIYINRYGNSGLAKGGSGDALTGIITGLLAQNMRPIDAARLGVYIHAKSGDYAKEKYSEYSFLASDTINFIGNVINKLI